MHEKEMLYNSLQQLDDFAILEIWVLLIVFDKKGNVVRSLSLINRGGTLGLMTKDVLTMHNNFNWSVKKGRYDAEILEIQQLRERNH